MQSIFTVVSEIHVPHVCGSLKIVKKLQNHKISGTLSSSQICFLSSLYSLWIHGISHNQFGPETTGLIGRRMGDWSDYSCVGCTLKEHWKVGENHHKNHGCIYPPSPLWGRHQLLSSDIVKEFYELLIESPSLLLNKIREWLAIYHDQPISMTPLHNNLKDLRLIYKCLQRITMEWDDAYWWNACACQQMRESGFWGYW